MPPPVEPTSPAAAWGSPTPELPPTGAGGPPVAWVTATKSSRDVPGAPGLVFADTASRLITTVRSPVKQGFHDRFANSAVVRPSTSSSNGLVSACLIAALVLGGLAILSIFALIFLGSQVSNILDQSGRSI